MVDKFCARTADGAIDSPVIVERKEIDEVVVCLGAALGFPAADSLAGVFNHFAPGGDAFGGIDAPAVNFRTCELHAEAGIARINTACQAGRFTALSARGRRLTPGRRLRSFSE